jgi:hypothetical protein
MTELVDLVNVMKGLVALVERLNFMTDLVD